MLNIFITAVIKENVHLRTLRAHLIIDIILPYLPDHDHHHPTTTEQLTVLHRQRVTACLVAVTTADLPASCWTQTVSEH